MSFRETLRRQRTMTTHLTEIRPKSGYQKNTCLFCNRAAVNEAHSVNGQVSSTIRHCDDSFCKIQAQAMASKRVTMWSN